MKVLVDTLGAKIGGARTYALNVFPRLGRLAPDWQFAVYVSEKLIDHFKEVPPNVELRTAPWAERSYLAHLLWQQVGLPIIARREGFEVIYSAMGFAPILPVCRRVLLVRNPIYFSRFYFSRLRTMRKRLEITFRRLLSILSIRTSDLTIFPTRAMQELANRMAHASESRLRVIHYGFDRAAFERACEGPVPEPLRRMEEDKTFKVLAVSFLSDQKNYATLFRAVALAWRQIPAIRLYMAGAIREVPDFRGSEEERALMSCPEGSVVFLGALGYGHLRRAYEAASAFVFPSYLESFGHPMVEAMNFGLPIVAADAPVNREVCADAALYHKTIDASDLAGKLIMLARDATLRQILAAKARERAKAFDWDEHAKGVIDAIASRCG